MAKASAKTTKKHKSTKKKAVVEEQAVNEQANPDVSVQQEPIAATVTAEEEAQKS